MFNVAIINKKQILNFSYKIIIVLFGIFTLTKLSKKLQKNENFIINIKNSFTICLENELPLISYKGPNSNELNNENEKKITEKLFGYELAKMIKQSDTISSNNVENEKEEEEVKQEQLQKAELGLQTEIVTKYPIKESYNLMLNSVKVKNETTFDLNENTISELDINKKNILIFHTHTCESYTPSEMYPYEQTGNFRTTDLGYSVSRVGDELSKYLLDYGFNVLHNRTYHDYPAYTGSYTRSLATVQGILSNNPSDIIIDLHRDAIGSNSQYDPTVKIGEDYAAQLMFVIGTNGGGLYHPNWDKNLSFAVKVQEKANEMYPGLFKPMIVRNSRYNQHLGKAATIIEVGSTGNTLEQCLISMKYLSKILDELLV